jgi:hypothetical protein
MLAFAIGFAIFMLIVLVFKRKAEIKGLFGILMFGVACWGLGKLILILFGR